jgi:hypothetical protein
LWGVTTIDRVRYCGRRRSKRDEAPQVKVREGVAHFARLMLCGRVWVCPVCGPRIRQERATELDAALATWLEQHGEGSVILATYTLPHVATERLGALLGLVRDAFAGFTSGEQWAKLRADFGLVGYVRAHDATHGANGWHPHLHVVYVAERPVSPEQVEALHARQFKLWENVVRRLGHRPPMPEALSVEVARRREDVARYALQVVSGDADGEGGLSSVALELARGDLKTGRRDGQRTPWEILAGATRRICDTDGVLDEDAERARARDRVLWREWETCTKGVHAVQWSRGLRGAIGLGAEQSDEDVVAIEVGGEVVYEFTDRMAWLAVCDVRGGQARVLRAAERWGARGCARMVAALLRRWRRERAKLGALGGVTPHDDGHGPTGHTGQGGSGTNTLHKEGGEHAAQGEGQARGAGEHPGHAVVEHHGTDARADGDGDATGHAGCSLQLPAGDERGGRTGHHRRVSRRGPAGIPG